MLSEKFRNLIERSVNSFSAKEQLYDLLDEFYRNKKLDYYELKNIVKGIDKAPKSLYQYFTNFIRYELEDSLLNLFHGKSASQLERKFVAEFAEQFMNCLNRINCNKYRSLVNKLDKEKFGSWSKFWNPDNIKDEVDKVAKDAMARQATQRYSDETMQCVIEFAKKDNIIDAEFLCQNEMDKAEVIGRLVETE